MDHSNFVLIVQNEYSSSMVVGFFVLGSNAVIFLTAIEIIFHELNFQVVVLVLNKFW